MAGAASRLIPGRAVLAPLMLAVVLACFASSAAEAQRRTGPAKPVPPKDDTARPGAAAAQPPPAPPVDVRPPERVEADVSSRSIAVTSGYTGTRIIVFGTVLHSRQPSALSGYYDVVVVLEGVGERVIARKKERTWGIWRNAEAITFTNVPSFYAIVSTRPPDDLAEKATLMTSRIGFEHVQMTPGASALATYTQPDLATFKQAVVRLKGDRGLYLDSPYGVSFIGSSLFRATVDLPANVPIGQLTARIHLFRNGQLLDTFQSAITLEREGLERALHGFAFDYALLYGIVTVLTALGAGLAASAVFNRGSH
jgi:uncharacterized protein (TIGR02186 family)